MKKLYSRLLLVLAVSMFVFTGFAASLPSSLPAPVNQDPQTTAKAALTEFKSLSHKEKKERIKEARKALKAMKAESKAKREPLTSTAVQVIVAILLPPLGVYLHEGEINNRFWISLLLTLLFYVPGLIYALVIILGDK